MIAMARAWEKGYWKAKVEDAALLQNLVEACWMVLKALESPEGQKVLAFSQEGEALREALRKLSPKEMIGGN